jgi:hypothetical protein
VNLTKTKDDTLKSRRDVRDSTTKDDVIIQNIDADLRMQFKISMYYIIYYVLFDLYRAVPNASLAGGDHSEKVLSVGARDACQVISLLPFSLILRRWNCGILARLKSGRIA